MGAVGHEDDIEFLIYHPDQIKDIGSDKTRVEFRYTCKVFGVRDRFVADIHTGYDRPFARP